MPSFPAGSGNRRHHIRRSDGSAGAESISPGAHVRRCLRARRTVTPYPTAPLDTVLSAITAPAARGVGFPIDAEKGAASNLGRTPSRPRPGAVIAWMNGISNESPRPSRAADSKPGPTPAQTTQRRPSSNESNSRFSRNRAIRHRGRLVQRLRSERVMLAASGDQAARTPAIRSCSQILFRRSEHCYQLPAGGMPPSPERMRNQRFERAFRSGNSAGYFGESPEPSIHSRSPDRLRVCSRLPGQSAVGRK